MTTASTRSLLNLPKAHLHLHLEGAMRPATLAELAKRYGVEVPLGPDRFLGFQDFQRLYRTASGDHDGSLSCQSPLVTCFVRPNSTPTVRTWLRRSSNQPMPSKR
jgi:adenosine deaminase